jgi:hypothetical protein
MDWLLRGQYGGTDVVLRVRLGPAGFIRMEWSRWRYRRNGTDGMLQYIHCTYKTG